MLRLRVRATHYVTCLLKLSNVDANAASGTSEWLNFSANNPSGRAVSDADILDVVAVDRRATDDADLADAENPARLVAVSRRPASPGSQSGSSLSGARRAARRRREDQRRQHGPDDSSDDEGSDRPRYRAAHWKQNTNQASSSSGSGPQGKTHAASSDEEEDDEMVSTKQVELNVEDSDKRRVSLGPESAEVEADREILQDSSGPHPVEPAVQRRCNTEDTDGYASDQSQLSDEKPIATRRSEEEDAMEPRR